MTEKTDGSPGKVAPEVDTQGKQLCTQMLFVIAEECNSLNGHIKGDPLNKLWYSHRREPTQLHHRMKKICMTLSGVISRAY